MLFRTAAVGLAALSLAACATAPSGSGRLDVAIGTPTPDTSPYGLFLAGRAASNRGDATRAAGYFGRASEQDAEAAFLRQRAFSSALAAGDVTRAAVLAPQSGGDDDIRQLGLVVRGVEALASGRGETAHALLTAEDINPPHRAAAFLLRPWAAAGAGQMEQALAAPEPRGDVIYRYFGRLSQARMLERAGRPEEAESIFRSLLEQGDPDSVASLAYGGFLERRGRWQDALAIYETGLERSPADMPLAAARDRARVHRTRPAAPSIREGAAEALMGPAQAMMVMRRGELALSYLRLALRLDPNRGDAWILVGDLLAARGDNEGAREAYGRVPRTAGQFFPAQAKIAWNWWHAGDRDRAVTAARQLAADAPISSGAAVTLAEMLRQQGAHAEAADVLTRVIDSPVTTRDWRLYYLRANALREAGRWPEAERDIQAGLALSPQQAELLNFLAYAWIDRGERLDEALTMVQSAAASSPQSGEIQDSLGWAYYRLGRFADAVATLERAVELAPADAQVNDHLGDAYWRAGRRTEAVFQWRRVLSLEPDARLRAAAEAKIASPRGPDAAPAPPPPVAPTPAPSAPPPS